MSKEIWKPIADLPNYQISSHGKVKSPKRTLNAYPNQKGYLRVALSYNGKIVQRSIHSLVLEAFVSKRPQGMVSRHLNGNKLDNRLENLAWGTTKENCLDKVIHGTLLNGESNPRSKLTLGQVKEIVSTYIPFHRKFGAVPLAKKYGVHKVTIDKIIHGKAWAAALSKDAPASKPGER
jgi:hypothetical protein